MAPLPLDFSVYSRGQRCWRPATKLFGTGQRSIPPPLLRHPNPRMRYKEHWNAQKIGILLGKTEKIRLCVLGVPSTEFILSAAEGLGACLAR